MAELKQNFYVAIGLPEAPLSDLTLLELTNASPSPLRLAQALSGNVPRAFTTVTPAEGAPPIWIENAEPPTDFIISVWPDPYKKHKVYIPPDKIVAMHEMPAGERGELRRTLIEFDNGLWARAEGSIAAAVYAMAHGKPVRNVFIPPEQLSPSLTQVADNFQNAVETVVAIGDEDTNSGVVNKLYSLKVQSIFRGTSADAQEFLHTVISYNLRHYVITLPVLYQDLAANVIYHHSTEPEYPSGASLRPDFLGSCLAPPPALLPHILAAYAQRLATQIEASPASGPVAAFTTHMPQP